MLCGVPTSFGPKYVAIFPLFASPICAGKKALKRRPEPICLPPVRLLRTRDFRSARADTRIERIRPVSMTRSSHHSV